MLKDHQDAMGHMMYDFYRSKTGFEIVERDDGFISVGMGPAAYFTTFPDWFSCEKTGIKSARGKILDIGCGAGRHSLYLQNKGYDVTGIDLSPLAVKVAKMRGLKKVHNVSLTALTPRFGIFDTILMLGNNSALLGNFKRGRWLLKRFHTMTSPDSIIIAQNRDPYATTLPEHREYHRQNRKKGKLPGEARIRIRYKKFISPWKKFLLVSPDEMKKLLEGTGWHIRKIIRDHDGIYVALIDKVNKPL